MKRRTIKIGLLLTFLAFGLFIWRFFILSPDKINFHHELTLSTEKVEYFLGDSILLKVSIIPTDGKGLVRLYDDNSNMQIYARKAINGDISPSDWGDFDNLPYKSKCQFLFYNWTSYNLTAGQKIEKVLRGKIYLDTDKKIAIDFGHHGKYKSPYYKEYAIEVDVFELFPDIKFPIDLDYFIPTTNFVYIKLADKIQ